MKVENMSYEKLKRRLWNDLKPKIIELIKEENDPFKKLDDLEKNMDKVGKVFNLLGQFDKIAKGDLDANDFKLGGEK